MDTTESQIFSEYEKISGNFKKVDEKVMTDMDRLKWVVTEKVHGANFSFIYQDKKLHFAKRKNYLLWSDNFFGYQSVVNKLENKIMELFEALSRDITASKYTLYGELFGGEFPHQKVEANKNVKAIQTGIYYSPDIEFYAFDIAIENKNGLKYYLDYKDALTYFENYGLIYAKPLYTGKLNNCMEFDMRINSTIPNLLKIPTLENNLIEGVVIKPLQHLSVVKDKARPIIKLKNKEFEEEDEFHQSEKWSYTLRSSSNTEELSFIVDELRRYVTQNRLNSVISKTGQIDVNNKQRASEIMQEYLRDVFFDFNENNDKLLDDLTATQQKWIQNRIESDITDLICKQE